MAQGSVPPTMHKHLAEYLATNGRVGHMFDARPFGGLGDVPTLILKTTGRVSGEPRLIPLIYIKAGEDYVIIASNGGAPAHPSWYLNMCEADEVRIQVADHRYRASWRVAEGEERAALWARMAEQHPPYNQYPRKTDRLIPLVVLHPEGEVKEL